MSDRSRVEVNLNPRVRKAVLSSSMEYEEYLAQRMSSSSNDRRQSRGGLYDHTISSQSRQRNASGGGMDSKDDFDGSGGRPPLQHSWRMHVNNEEGVHGIAQGRHRTRSRNDGDQSFEKVPQNPSEIALLMRQAKLSMEESIKRSNIIDQLITEGSSSSVDVDVERKSYLMSSMESLDDAYEYDWKGRAVLNGSTKIRTLTLKRAFNTLTSAVKTKKKTRENTVQQLQLDKKEALRRKYLQTWKLHAKEARISNSLQKDRLRKTLQGWKVVSEGRKRSLQLAEEQYKMATKARILDTFKELMITRQVQEKERVREEEYSRVSRQYRDQRLMQRAFEGLQKMSKMSVGQKELMEESASRRKRIATLVSALKSKEGSGMTTRKKEKTPPRTKPFQKSNLSEAEARRKALAQQGPVYNRRSDLTDRLINHERESKRKGDNEKVSIQIPPMVPIAFSESRFLDGSDRDEDRGYSSRRLEGKETDLFDRNVRYTNDNGSALGKKYGYNAKGQWDDGFNPQSSFDDSEYGESKNGDDSDIDADDESLSRPPPPAYQESIPKNNHQKGRTGVKIRSTRTSELRALPPRNRNTSSNTRNDDASDTRATSRQQTKESNRKAEEISKKSGADVLPQEVLDERAEQRRQRIGQLRKQSQERVMKSTMERERQAKMKQDEEDMEFLQMQQERRAKLESLKRDTEKTKEMEEAMKGKKEKASKFYLQKLLLRRGLQPWRELTDQARINWVKAMDFREDTLLQSTWIALYGYCRMQRSVRARQEYRQGSMAVAFYRYVKPFHF
jgi:hypothetical protein